MSNEKYMRMCLELALIPRGHVAPNPYVGAVLVKDGKIIGKGYHQGPGRPHGEIEAINDARSAGKSVEGATVFCNLEPCCHTNKRTPPCAQRLVKEGVKKVVIANLDPNPRVAGRGVKILEEAGIEVVSGVLEKEGREVNEVFFKHIVAKFPFVHIKWAQTLDGKIATKTKSSKWITSEAAREKVHWERLAHDAIMVGAGTLREDNPSLTVRKNEKIAKEIKRVVVAGGDSFDKNLKFFSDEQKHNSILFRPGEGQDQVDLTQVFKELYEKGVCSVYVEGGSSLLTQIFKQNLYDRISVYMAPKILGEGVSPIGDLGIEDMNQAVELQDVRIETLGNNIYFSAKAKANPKGNIKCSQDS